MDSGLSLKIDFVPFMNDTKTKQKTKTPVEIC